MPVLGEDVETRVPEIPLMGGGQNTKVLLNLSLNFAELKETNSSETKCYHHSCYQ